ncbi:MAG: UDP-N-acetylglucosamine 2-epimerase (non-hydrolyzing), partial [Hyphomicrobium sp.]
EVTLHTGQHFDHGMSDVFFEELGLPRPTYRLDINSGNHGEMTGRMLAAIEEVLLVTALDAVLVYGDTNSTLAGALAAAKLCRPVIHVEAGLRSFNRAMPEEINRVVADHLSDLLLCPTAVSIGNLKREGITENVIHVGDVMYDSTLLASPIAKTHSRILTALGLEPGDYALATVHRADNTASAEALERVLSHIADTAGDTPVILATHPRTRKAAEKFGVTLDRGPIRAIEPLGFLDMCRLMSDASKVFTDSGGMQKEAYFHRVPCVTLRSETEWVETVESGWNRLWSEPDYVVPRRAITDYGTGHAAEACIDAVEAWLKAR